MKVALAFFGLTRSLKYTLDSINRNILLPLIQNNAEFKIFLHTYEINTAGYDNSEYKLLEPDYFQLDNQDEISIQIDLFKYRTHKDPWRSNYKSVNNFILAQYSKLQVCNLITNSEEDFDCIIFLRPDVFFNNTLKYTYLLNSKQNLNFFFTPSFHQFGKPLINDRFAICNKNNYKFYGEIFNDLYEYSKRWPLHSESIIGKSMITIKKQRKVVIKNFHFSRIRSGGVIFKRDLTNLININYLENNNIIKLIKCNRFKSNVSQGINLPINTINIANDEIVNSGN